MSNQYSEFDFGPQTRFTYRIFASGGAGTPQHLLEALDEGKADAVLAASIFHYNQYSITEVKEYLKSRGIPIRVGR